MTHSLFGNTTRNQIAKLILACALLAPTSGAMAGEVSPLKIETISAHSATVASATVKGMDNKVYVSGRIQINLPYQPSTGAHVDVYLKNAKGQTLAHQKDPIIVTSQKRDRTQGGQFSYAVSFDDSVAAQAVAARIVYCDGPHGNRS